MYKNGEVRMLNKWLDMLGLYDFLGVICPGIFATGLGLSLIYINVDISSEAVYSFINQYKVVKHFVYSFSVVSIYILGSFIHEVGHYFAHIYNVGCKSAISQISFSIRKSRKAFSEKGNDEAEKLFFIYDFSNTNIIERSIWFELMKRGDFCRNNNEFDISGSLDSNIQLVTENFKIKSAAFYQHCKRVISLNGYSASSKKKESIYGFCRNISAIFGGAIACILGGIVFSLGCCLITVLSSVTVDKTVISIIVDFVKQIIQEKLLVKYFLEIIVLLPFFVVFSAKSIRYKNMEIIDTIRTYRYLAENKKKHSKKQKYDK